MDVWHLVIIAGATLVALKCLSSLMASHRIFRFDEEIFEIQEQLKAQQNSPAAIAASLAATAADNKEVQSKATPPIRQRKAA